MRRLCHTHPLHTLNVSFSASFSIPLSFCPSPFPNHPAFFYLPPSHPLIQCPPLIISPSPHPSLPSFHRCSVPLTLTCFPLPSSPNSLCIAPSLFSSNLHPSFSNRPVPFPLHPIHPVLSRFLPLYFSCWHSTLTPILPSLLFPPIATCRHYNCMRTSFVTHLSRT